jgi:regulation of enolase protein 1 (concanavalin A-like superfamily)
MWLVKTEKDGTAQWNQSYGGVNIAWAEALVQTADGGFVLAGGISLNGSDMWLVKTDDKGGMQWNQSYGGTHLEWSYDLIQTMDGGFALAGDTTSYGAGENDMWLVKIDASGEVLWSQTYGGTSHERAHALLQTPDGGFALAGKTESWGNGFADMLLVKTDPNGVLLWDKTYGGTGFEYAHALIQTPDGGFALAGTTTSYGAGSYDMWLVKTDIDGSMQWSKTFGGTEYDFAGSLLQTPDGGFVIAGSTRSFGVANIWLVKTPGYTPTIPSHVIFGVFLLGGLGALIVIRRIRCSHCNYSFLSKT